MTKKKVVKKISKKKTVKTALPTLDGYMGFDPLWLNTPENRLRIESERLARKIAKEKLNTDGYSDVRTTTFTSTTFDDIVAFPKYPVHKEGYHISKEIAIHPGADQVLITKVKFEKDSDCKFGPDSSFKVRPTISYFINRMYKIANGEDLSFDPGIDLLKSIKEINRILNEDIINTNRFSTKENQLAKQTTEQLIGKISKGSTDKLIDDIVNGMKDPLPKFPIINSIKANVNEPKIELTNKQKVNNANKLFEDLAEKAGKITKEYCQAKHKFILMNRFMEEFYAGKEFESIEREEIFDLNEQLEILMNN